MHVRVDSALHVERRHMPDKLLGRLYRELSFANPGYVTRVRMGLPTGAEPEELCFLSEGADEIRLPRGAIHMLRQQAAHEGLLVSCEDQRLLPTERLSGLPEVPLRAYQARAVDKLAKVTQGVVVSPCGSGKSRIGIGAIARLGTPALILVHTVDLAEQWQRAIADLLRLEAGLVGAGEERTAPVTVALTQTLGRWEPERLHAFLARFGLVILDEAHHVAASIFRGIVDRCPARYRLGLTATPEREDGLTPLLELYLGRTLVTISHDELVEAGVLTLPDIRVVHTAFEYPYVRAADYAPMLAALAEDSQRNELLVRTIAAEARQGHVCLALSGRIDHCQRLAELLQQGGVKAEALTGRLPKRRRQALLQQARDAELSVLVATSLADEGLDLPRLSRVFLTFPGRAKGRTVQRLGRLMRPHPDKQGAVLVDFVDGNVPVLWFQHQQRRRLYAAVLGLSPRELRSSVHTHQPTTQGAHA